MLHKTHPYEYELPKQYLNIKQISNLDITCNVKYEVKQVLNQFNKHEPIIVTIIGYNHVTLFFKNADDIPLFILSLP